MAADEGLDAPKKPGRPKKVAPPLPQDVTVRTKPDISVLEKRLSGGSPFGTESVQIPLREPGWTCYVANGLRTDTRLWEMVHVKGWIPVKTSDLACKAADFGFTVTSDGTLCRGPKGQEVVFKMPTADYQRLAAHKTAANNKAIGSSQRTKAELVSAAEKQFGDEAASYISRNAFGEVKDSRVLEEM